MKINYPCCVMQQNIFTDNYVEILSWLTITIGETLGGIIKLNAPKN
jgi:hypothetical protein